nr:hypothetical protein [Candidatus Sigynarchaeota archaeon]
MNRRTRTNPTGHGNDDVKIQLVFALSLVYSIIGWVGPGSIDDLLAFYKKNLLLAIVLIVTTVLVFTTGLLLSLLSISRRLSRPRRSRKERDIGANLQVLKKTSSGSFSGRKSTSQDGFQARARRVLQGIKNNSTIWTMHLQRFFLAIFAMLAIHSFLVRTAILRPPYGSISSITHAIIVILPAATWVILFVVDALGEGPLASTPDAQSLSISLGENKKKGEMAKDEARIMLGIMAGAWIALFITILTSPDLTPLLPVLLIAWIIDLLIRVKRLQRVNSQRLDGKSEK